MATAAEIDQARAAFENAVCEGCSANVTVPLGRELARLEDASDPAVKAKHLRTKARDLRAAYDRHMDEYGREIGRAQRIADPTIAKLVESAAKAALDEAGECLTAALAAEAEADAITSNGFVTLFDGVSAKQWAA